MKKVEAFIRHEAFEPIRMELLDLGFPSLSIMEVKGSGRQKGITERYRGAELTNYLRPKVKIECVVATNDVRIVVDTILRHARTGGVGARVGDRDPEARDDDRDVGAGGVRGELGDAAEAVAAQHRVDHLQMDGPQPLDQRGAADGLGGLGSCHDPPSAFR